MVGVTKGAKAVTGVHSRSSISPLFFKDNFNLSGEGKNVMLCSSVVNFWSECGGEAAEGAEIRHGGGLHRAVDNGTHRPVPTNRCRQCILSHSNLFFLWAFPTPFLSATECRNSSELGQRATQTTARVHSVGRFLAWFGLHHGFAGAATGRGGVKALFLALGSGVVQRGVRPYLG